MDFFVYNTGEGTLEINEYQLFLIKEFKDLLDDKRNKCKDDKTGKLKLQARKELTYIWLVMDPKSPYSQFTEQEAHTVALDDSGLTQKEFEDPIFRAACRKYKEILDSDRILKLLRAAYGAVDKLELYFSEMLDFTERKATDGTPVYKAKDVIAELKNLGDVVKGVKDVEILYKKGLESQNNSVRGDAKPGWLDA
jgi:hypothetical protein